VGVCSKADPWDPSVMSLSLIRIILDMCYSYVFMSRDRLTCIQCDCTPGSGASSTVCNVYVMCGDVKRSLFRQEYLERLLS
jgi:hypothetical protein